MKIIRYLDPDHRVGYAALQEDGTAVQISGDIWGEFSVTTKPASVAKLLAPLAPSNILCVGLNYRQHAAESKATIPEFPVLFMKLASTVQNPGDPIVLPRHLRSNEVDYEGELAVVIGRTCKNVSRDLRWTTCWAIPAPTTSAPATGKANGAEASGVGEKLSTPSLPSVRPWSPAEEIPNPNALAIRLDINGEVLQDWNTNDMIFDVPRLIEFLSGSTTLPAGTVILTGTPQGVGFARKPPRWLKAGDMVTVTIEKIGA